MRAHQQPMRFLVVWLQLEKLFQRAYRGLRFLPLELERRELLGRGDELTVRLFALSIDPWRAQVREKFSAVHSHRGTQILDRLARSSALLGLATAPQRPAEDLEVHVDRDGQGETVAGVGADDTRRLRGARRCERLSQGMQGEV